MKPSGVYEFPYKVRYDEVDRASRVMPATLFNYLQDSAVRASIAVGRGPHQLAEKPWGWFLVRIHMRVDRYPRLEDDVTVRTWAYRMKGLYAIREFHVVDAEGRTFAEGTSQWVIIDLARRRPIRLPEWVVEAYPKHPVRLVEHAFEKLPPMEEHDTERTFHVRLSDLDSNDHANSSCFFDWCLEAVPRSVHDELVPLSLEIDYRSEARYGDLVRARSRSDGESTADGVSFRHCIIRDTDGALLALGRSVWGQEPIVE